MLQAKKGKASAIMTAEKLACSSWAKIGGGGGGFNVKAGWEGRKTREQSSKSVYEIK